MIEGHNQSHMTPEQAALQAALADAPEWSDDDFNRLFPNG